MAAATDAAEDATVTEAASAAAENEEDADIARRALPELAPQAKVVIIAIEGNIDLGLAPFVERQLEEHSDADAFVLDVDTFGGRVDAAVRIRDALLGTDVPTVAYVNRRAISAGALISLSADHLVFAPGGSMGAATPVNIADDGSMEAVGEKMVSYMRAEMRATAEATGRDGDLAEAMVDRTVTIDGVVDDTKLLTVSTELATQLGLADVVHEEMSNVLDEMGAENAEVIRSAPNWAEGVARWLTDPTFAGILMSLGMLGLMVELYSPGVGLPGFVGVLCLSAFFGGHMVADLAGMEEVLVLFMGAALLGVEFFVVPGFGLPGLLGLFLICAALTMSMVGLPLNVAWNIGMFGEAMTRVAWSLTGTFIAMVAVVSLMPSGNALPRFLVLRTKLGDAPPTPDASQSDFHSGPDQRDLVGTTGVAETDLRPSGKARIDHKIVDVVSSHAWISRGDAIVVLAVEGVRVVVDKAEPDTPA
jgi:membrane-bound serine protease (ClpP class)